MGPTVLVFWLNGGRFEMSFIMKMSAIAAFAVFWTMTNQARAADQPHFAAIWVRPGGSAFVARHGLTSQQYQQEFDQLVHHGYCLTDVSGYAVGGQPRFAAIWERKTCPPFVARHGMTAQQYQHQFDQLVHQGFRLKLVDGYSVGGQDFYAAIWERSHGPRSVARHGMTSQQYQQEFDQLVRHQNYGLIWVDAY
jgi:hypothetical protein